MTVKTEPVNALVTIPDTLSAFKASADEGRVTFSFPRNQLGEYYKLAMMRDKVLRVTVEIEEDIKKHKSGVNY